MGPGPRGLPMAEYWIRLPDRAPLLLGREKPEISIGRASSNDLVLEDANLSRNHARLLWRDGGAFIEDLGSRNGTLVNGTPVHQAHPLGERDEVSFGRIAFRLEAKNTNPVQVAPGGDGPSTASIIMRVDHLRSPSQVQASGLAHAERFREALDIVHTLSVEMLGDLPTEMMLWGLLERIYAFLKPGRGVVLLKDAEGAMVQVAARSASGGQGFRVDLSRTMLEAALERHEALLINDPMLDSKLAAAQSMVISGVTTIMTVPLEHGGEVVGLVYLDAGPSRKPFEEEDLRLVAVLGHMAAAKIRAARLTEEVAQKKILEKEMALARQIQVRILPDKLPELAGFELFGINVACRQVSGDLYGAWPGPEGRTWLAIADVAGKGIGPGLLMATFQAFMQAWSEFAVEPAALAAKLSSALGLRTTSNRFITAFIALLDPAEGTLAYTNAGHNPILVLRADGTQELLNSQGLPLAMFPGREYGQGSGRLEQGDLMFLYTDGITEAADPEGVEFDIELIATLLRNLGPVPLEELHRGLSEALLRHTRGAPLADDQTLVLVRRTA